MKLWIFVFLSLALSLSGPLQAQNRDGERTSAGAAESPGIAQAAMADPVAEASWWQSAREILEAGGPVVLILLITSVRRTARQALALWRAGRAEEAVRQASAGRNPTAQALARAMRGRQCGLAEKTVREEVLRYGSNVLFTLRRGLRPLEVIGSMAPLLGLLGTVLGMIEAFQQLEAAGNQVNPAILSGGIWEALLTTAVGLCVAIPVVALLNWLERRVDHLAHEMDDVVTQVFTVDLAPESASEPVKNAASPAASQTADQPLHAEPRSVRTA